MLGTELAAGEPCLAVGAFPETEVTGLVGLAGSMAAQVSVHCSVGQAREFTARLLGLEPSEVSGNEEIRDAIGELANMIAGGVKTALSAEATLELALPSVFLAEKGSMQIGPLGAFVAPLDGPFGSFSVALVVKEK
ncbi:MAG: chemotaxis protein CheX [Myxococcota bacterium]